jgi:hypothetical protein
MDNIDIKQIEMITQIVFGGLSWVFLIGCIILLFRQVLENIVAGLVFRAGTGIRENQPILINGRGARFTKMGILYSYYYMELDRVTVMPVPNNKLKDLIIEIVLDPIGGNVPAIRLSRAPDPEDDIKILSHKKK